MSVAARGHRRAPLRSLVVRSRGEDGRADGRAVAVDAHRLAQHVRQQRGEDGALRHPARERDAGRGSRLRPPWRAQDSRAARTRRSHRRQRATRPGGSPSCVTGAGISSPPIVMPRLDISSARGPRNAVTTLSSAKAAAARASNRRYESRAPRSRRIVSTVRPVSPGFASTIHRPATALSVTHVRASASESRRCGCYLNRRAPACAYSPRLPERLRRNPRQRPVRQDRPGEP